MFSKAPWSSQADETPKQDEQSLTTILRTPEERSDLNRLIVDCTETMRVAILDNFDPRKTDEPLNANGETTAETTTNRNLSIEELEKIDNARYEKERIARELASSELRALKRAALDYFDNWRDSVILRVGEIINSKDASSEADQPPRKPPRPPKVNVPTEATSNVGIEEEEAPVKPPRPLKPAEVPQQTLNGASNSAPADTTEVKEDTSDEDTTQKLHELYPPHDTLLLHLSEAQRALVLHSILLLLLSLEHYPAQSRVLLLHVTSSLHLPLNLLTDDESKVARGLLEVAKTQMTADAETQDKIKKNALSRKWKVGLGAVGGAALLAVTGGLAAPLLAAGLGTVMGGLGLGATAAAGYMGALAGSSVLIGGLFGAYGGRMTSKMVDKYAKEVEDFAFIPILDAKKLEYNEQDSRRLRVAIGISGWLTEEEGIVKPWRIIGNGIEGFALRWELEALVKLGNALSTLLKSAAWGIAKKEIIRHTLFAALTAGLWPIMIVKASSIIDNPFSVAKSRSEKAGKVLAEALINKCQGERPVTLMGYSLGARVIYSCLQELAARRAFGIIESVVLVGAPTPSDPIAWRTMRSVVPGRIVNVFSTNDYILGYLYRTASLQSGVAGLQAVTNVKNIENVDVSDLVDGHMKYQYLVGSILKKIGFEDIDAAEAELEEQEMLEAQRKEEEARKASESKHGEDDVDAEVAEMEAEVNKRNQESMWSVASKKMSSLSFGGNKKETGENAPEYEKLTDAQGKMPADNARHALQ